MLFISPNLLQHLGRDYQVKECKHKDKEFVLSLSDAASDTQAEATLQGPSQHHNPCVRTLLCGNRHTCSTPGLCWLSLKSMPNATIIWPAALIICSEAFFRASLSTRSCSSFICFICWSSCSRRLCTPTRFWFCAAALAANASAWV